MDLSNERRQAVLLFLFAAAVCVANSAQKIFLCGGVRVKITYIYLWRVFMNNE